jgi:hypothetical protein
MVYLMPDGGWTYFGEDIRVETGILGIEYIPMEPCRPEPRRKLSWSGTRGIEHKCSGFSRWIGFRNDNSCLWCSNKVQEELITMINLMRIDI